MAAPAALVDRLRRRVGELLLGAEADDHSRLTADMCERHLKYASRWVAKVVADRAPHLLSDLHTTGTAAAVPGSLATVRVDRDGAPVERRSFAGAVRRPVAGAYVEADGRVEATDGLALSVTVVGVPADAGEMPEALHGAIVEEAAAAVYLALGGNGPEAWGRATDVLDDVLGS